MNGVLVAKNVKLLMVESTVLLAKGLEPRRHSKPKGGGQPVTTQLSATKLPGATTRLAG